MAFPWENLITGVSTLIAGLGGVSVTALLTGRNERQKLEHERTLGQVERRAGAYTRFLQVSHADMRGLAVALTVLSETPTRAEADRIVEELRRHIVLFNEGLAHVEVVGSDEAAHTARRVSEAARDLGRTCMSLYDSLNDPDRDRPGFEADHRRLRGLVSEFADLCRRELDATSATIQ